MDPIPRPDLTTGVEGVGELIGQLLNQRHPNMVRKYRTLKCTSLILQKISENSNILAPSFRYYLKLYDNTHCWCHFLVHMAWLSLIPH
jgi:hypothetical protein